MFCNKCGKEIKEGTPFCPNCGNNLGEKKSPKVEEAETGQGIQNSVKEPVVEQPVQPVIPQGQYIDPKAQQFGQVQYQQAPKKKKGGTVLLVVLIVIAVIIAGGAVFYFTVFQSIMRDRLVVEADKLAGAEEYEDAIEVYEEVLKEDKEHDDAKKGLTEAYLALVELELEDNNFEEAKNFAEEGEDATDSDEFEEYLEMFETGKFYDKDDVLIKQLIFDETGKVTSYMIPTYDEGGKEIEVSYYNLDDEMTHAIQNEYDESGNLIMTYFFEEGSDYSNYSEEYDTDGNVIIYTEYDVNTGNALWAEGYNASGDIVAEAYYDEEGEVSSFYEYDDYGNLISDSFYSEDGSYIITFYDEYGEISQMAYYDVDGSYTTYEYDNDGYLMYENIYNADDSIRYYVFYEHFVDGTLRYSYNDEDEIMYIYDYDEYGNLLQFAKYGYDEKLFWSREFDAYGNIYRQYYYDDDEVCYEYYEYTYSGDGNILSRIKYDYLSGEIIDYVMYDYDNAGNELGSVCYWLDGTINWYTINELAYDGSVLIEYQYDAYDFLESYTEYEYDENANNTKETIYNPDGTVYKIYERTYDEEGNLITYKKTNEDGELEEDMYFEYDTDGNQIYKKNYAY